MSRQEPVENRPVNFLTILPMAVVMVAGPQLVSAVFLATSRDPRRTSAAFIAGVAAAVTAGVTAAYWLARALDSPGDSRDDSGGAAIDWIVLALLAVLMVVVFLRRNTTEPPKWMGRLQTATPRFSAKLGFLLFLLMPTDVITMVAVGATLARNQDPWWKCVPFILLTLLLIALPVLLLLLFGRRALAVLPRIRDWMNAHSWIVSEFVIAFFAAMTISSIAG